MCVPLTNINTYNTTNMNRFTPGRMREREMMTIDLRKQVINQNYLQSVFRYLRPIAANTPI